MPAFKRLKMLFTKEGFDFDDPDITLHKFHSQLRVLLLPMGIFFNNQNSKLRLVWPMICIAMAVVAIIIQMLCVFHCLQTKDYSFAIECFCYVMLLVSVPLVYSSMSYGKDHVLQILDEMNKDFIFVCKLSSKYRNHFLQNQLLIWKLCFGWLCFYGLMVAMFATMTLGSLIYQTLFANQDKYVERPLIFPVCLPNADVYQTPIYELFLCFELIFLANLLFFAVYVYLQFHVLLHNSTILDLIIMDFGVIFEGLDEGVATLARFDPRRIAQCTTLNGRMKRIATWHNSVFQSIDRLSSVQGLPLVYQLKFSSIIMCLLACQIANNLEQGKLNILFVMLFLGTVGQVWIPCYLGTMLRNKGYAVGDACWDCGWHKTSLSLLLRTDITFVILRSQQPLSIKYIGLPSLSLETFSSIMSAAYSYFNMIRQYN